MGERAYVRVGRWVFGWGWGWGWGWGGVCRRDSMGVGAMGELSLTGNGEGGVSGGLADGPTFWDQLGGQ